MIRDEIILSVRGLDVSFKTSRGTFRAVDCVDFDLFKGKSLGIVGESGSGKSTVARAIMRLLPERTAIAGGSIIFDDEDLLKAGRKGLREIRGKRIGMMMQDALSSLDPLFTAGYQIMEAVGAHNPIGRKKAREKALELMKLTGIPEPEIRMNSYPHQLSGGMRQRILFAMAVAQNPSLLIADEPTTALDVSMQRQILDLIAEMRERLGLSLLLVSHDIAVVSGACDSIAVMYAGRMVESGPARDCLSKPLHPYLAALLSSHPP
ncbi:MAG: ABC transporter ATP-binding protein, partial [Deltaproteobacteria bacterium]|nr:ABC transporter ATP-binding protein [Deltaproteobacteria bacterium]